MPSTVTGGQHLLQACFGMRWFSTATTPPFMLSTYYRRMNVRFAHHRHTAPAYTARLLTDNSTIWLARLPFFCGRTTVLYGDVTFNTHCVLCFPHSSTTPHHNPLLCVGLPFHAVPTFSIPPFFLCCSLLFYFGLDVWDVLCASPFPPSHAHYPISQLLLNIAMLVPHTTTRTITP